MNESTVSLRTQGSTLELDGTPLEPVLADLQWSVYNPVEVIFDFTNTDGSRCPWKMSRELIAAALKTDGITGYRDADVYAGGRLAAPWFVLSLRSAVDGNRTLARFPRADVEAFIAITRGEIEIGSDEEVQIIEDLAGDALYRALDAGL